MEKLTKIAEQFRGSIDFAEQHGDNLDAASWGDEEGVLISHNEAKLLLGLIEEKLNEEE